MPEQRRTPPPRRRTILADGARPADLYQLLNSVVVPRPIAWVSTLGADGTPNLAPHSYFTAVASDPPAVAFSSIGEKDTVRNLRRSGEFVVHIVQMALVERMNLTSVQAPPDVSEFALAGLDTAVPARVAAPIVEEAAVAIECSVLHELAVGDGILVIGECLAFHIADDLYGADDRVDPGRLDAVARMGGATYATTRDRFDLRRPRYDYARGLEYVRQERSPSDGARRP